MPSEALIEVSRVSKCFERGLRVLDDVTFSVPRNGTTATGTANLVTMTIVGS